MGPRGNGYLWFLGTSYYSSILGVVEHLLWTSFNTLCTVHASSLYTLFCLFVKFSIQVYTSTCR